MDNAEASGVSGGKAKNSMLCVVFNWFSESVVVKVSLSFLGFIFPLFAWNGALPRHIVLFAWVHLSTLTLTVKMNLYMKDGAPKISKKSQKADASLLKMQQAV